LLKVEGLRVHYKTKRGMLKAVDDVSFSLEKGKILALVGESGCGKTTVALSLVQLLPPAARILGGKITLFEDNLLTKTESQMRDIRWKKISLVFQGSLNSLNPVLTVRQQITEAISAHDRVGKEELDSHVQRLFKGVGLDPSRAKNFPHEFSGGMKQRAMIAMALACDPQIVIADEPTTALDVIVQYQILELMRSLRDYLQLSMILITHDLQVVAELCDEVVIMYAGKVVESGDVYGIFENPQHPYTRALLRAVPKMEGAKTELRFVPGSVPDLTRLVPACRFHSRCPYGRRACEDVEPKMEQSGPNHFVACHFWKEIENS